MAHGIFSHRQRSAEARRDPVPMIDHCVVVATLALFLFLLGSVAFASQRDMPQQRPACAPDLVQCCDRSTRNPDCTPVSLRHELHQLGQGAHVQSV